MKQEQPIENETIKIIFRDIEFEIDLLGFIKDKNGGDIFLVDPLIVQSFKDERGKVSNKRFMRQPLNLFFKRLIASWYRKEITKDYDNNFNNLTEGNTN